MATKQNNLSNWLTPSRKWLIIGLIVSFFQPVPSGLILGFGLYSEPQYKKQGQITLIFSLIWAIFVLIVIRNSVN